MVELAEAEEEMEREQRWAELQRERNKSRLSASDRRILHGRPPLRGVEWEETDDHRSQKFKVRALNKLIYLY